MNTLDISLSALFAVLTMIGAWISIPIGIVPITLQTLFTYLAATLLGAKRGALSQLIYIMIGVTGLPVFAGGHGGAEVLFGPTGGYLIGFIIGAFITGKLYEIREKPSFIWILFCILIGTFVIYILGILQLSYWIGSIREAIIVGILLFLPGDIIKMILASYLTLKIQPILPNQVKKIKKEKLANG